MNDKHRSIPVPDPNRQELEYVCPPASWGDMTGLIPAITEQDGARTSYQEMYPYLPRYNADTEQNDSRA